MLGSEIQSDSGFSITLIYKISNLTLIAWIWKKMTARFGFKIRSNYEFYFDN